MRRREMTAKRRVSALSILVLIPLLAALLSPVVLAEEADIEGHWEGTIDLPNAKLGILIRKRGGLAVIPPRDYHKQVPSPVSEPSRAEVGSRMVAILS